MPTDDDKLLLYDVGRAAANVGGGVPVEGLVHEADILALFDRCRSTFGAIRTLVWEDEPDFGQEAAVLARSVFTESLMLMELAAVDGAKRAALVIGWVLAGIDSFEGILREAAADGHDTSEELAMITNQRRIVEAYARKLGVRTRKWKVDEKALAEKHGRDDYLSFLMTHHFVHGSSVALSQRYSRDGNVSSVGGTAAATGWGLPSALFAASSVLHATRSVCAIFGWDEPPALDSLHERLEAADPSRASA